MTSQLATSRRSSCLRNRTCRLQINEATLVGGVNVCHFLISSFRLRKLRVKTTILLFVAHKQLVAPPSRTSKYKILNTHYYFTPPFHHELLMSDTQEEVTVAVAANKSDYHQRQHKLQENDPSVWSWSSFGLDLDPTSLKSSIESSTETMKRLVQ